MVSADIEAELGRGERLFAQALYGEAVACARGVLAKELGNERALDLIERVEQRAGVHTRSLADGEWSTGEVIDERWTVFGSAQGGMGRVYFVRDRTWENTELAVKSFLEPIHVAKNARVRVRELFRRETQIWLDLGAHPHIVSGYYTLEVQGRLRFFMEFVPGQTLLTIAQTGSLPLPRVLDFAIQIASGIAYVHDRGIVHRDLKPANCLVMADDTIRISDFGLGKSVDQREAGRSPGSFAIGNLSAHGAGTPFYMAPEQWGSLAAAERPADIYAIGVMLWELLAGRRPFEPSPACWSLYPSLPTPIARLVASSAPPSALLLPLMHAELPPLPLRRLGLAIPAEVDDLILSCLAKAPGKRPSAAELHDQLMRAHRAVMIHVPARKTAIAIEPSAAGESNRALSYDVMGERAHAISILDCALVRDSMAPYPWLNRAAFAIEDGTPPCVYAARANLELLPAHPGLLDDGALRPMFDRLARYYQPCPPVMSLDVTDAICVVGCQGFVVMSDAKTGRVRMSHGVSDIVLGVTCLSDMRVAAADGPAIAVFQLSAQSQTPSWLVGHRDLVTGLAASLDGSQLATTSNDGTLAVWDIGTRSMVWRAALPALARSVTWHPSGAMIVTTTTGQLYQIDREHRPRRLVREGALCSAIGPEGAIVIGGRDGTLTCLGSGAATIPAHDAAVIAVHSAGGVIASVDENGRVRAWGPSGLVAEAPAIHGRIRGLRVAPSGTDVFIGSEAGGVHVWTLHPTGAWSRTIQRDLPALEKRRRTEQVVAISTRLGAGDPSTLVDADLMRSRYPGHGRDPQLLAARHHIIHAGGLASGASDVYSAWTSRLPDGATGIATSADGRLAVSMPNGVAILDGHTGASIGHLGYPANVGVSLTGSNLVSADDSGQLMCADLDGAVHWTARWLGTGQLRTVACAADVVVAGGWARSAMRTTWQHQGAIRLWWITGRKHIELKRMGQTTNSVAISSDASVVAAGLDDGRVMVWAVDRQEVVCEVQGSGEVTAIVLSPDVRRVVIGYATGQIAICILAEETVVVCAQSRRGAVTSLSFTADGRWLCSAARDGSVAVFELPSLRCVLDVQAHSHAARARISRDGARIATASEDGTARLWRVVAGWSPPGQIVDELAGRIATAASSGYLPLDEALDTWRVLSRIRSLPALPADVRRHADVLASTIATSLRATVTPQPAISTAARIRNPYSRVLAVDAGLAALWSPLPDRASR